MSKARNWLEEEDARNALAEKPVEQPVKEPVAKPAERAISTENATERGESDLRESGARDKRGTNKKMAVLTSLQGGATVVAACRLAGMGTTTYYRWRVEDEEFRAATDAAQEAAIAVVEDSLFRQATGADGGKRNIVAAIFWLCNRAPGRWKHVNKVEVSGADGQDLTVILRGMAAKRDELAKRWGGEDNGDGLGN